MYITISPQKLSGKFSLSVADFVNYLEKENLVVTPHKEFFFNQYCEEINPETVISEIDKNTAKLKRTEPHYYSITINPSQRELQHLNNCPRKLKAYTNELMHNYAASFNREINGRPVSISDLKYFAKLEYKRTYKEYDPMVKMNQPYLKELAKRKHELVRIERGDIEGNPNEIRKIIKQINAAIPHKINSRPIDVGMEKPGSQMHVHIIISRKDQSNSYSLSPGSKYKASQVQLHGKLVKRGFDRDKFFAASEQTFDKLYGFQRNYVEHYRSRKMFLKDPSSYYRKLMNLTLDEKKLAYTILNQARVPGSVLKLPAANINYTLKHLKKILNLAYRSTSIGY